MLLRALRLGDQGLIGALSLASRSRCFGGMEPGRPVGGSYYLYRTLRGLELEAAARGHPHRVRRPDARGGGAGRVYCGLGGSAPGRRVQRPRSRS